MIVDYSGYLRTSQELKELTKLTKKERIVYDKIVSHFSYTEGFLIFYFRESNKQLMFEIIRERTQHKEEKIFRLSYFNATHYHISIYLNNLIWGEKK